MTSLRDIIAAASTPEKLQRTKESLFRHRRTLNRLEPHLGCVVCRGRLSDGVCLTCDPLVDLDPESEA